VKKSIFIQNKLIFTFEMESNIGIKTNLMKPTWALGFVTLSLSMKGATGRPSIFSLSLWLKYSSSKQSNQGSLISVGLFSKGIRFIINNLETFS
jgi:hypothetical protein